MFLTLCIRAVSRDSPISEIYRRRIWYTELCLCSCCYPLRRMIILSVCEPSEEKIIFHTPMPMIRCPWCRDDPLYMQYHDKEWGIPVHDDAILFEFLILEWAQAGLSWITVLRKRENYLKHFYNWNRQKIAQMTDDELETILLDPGIIRNRLKIYSVRKNAQVALQIEKEFGSLDSYFWWDHSSHHSDARRIQDTKTVDPLFYKDDTYHRLFPTINHPSIVNNPPIETAISKAFSKDLKKRGMSFVGSTIMYAFMQATGMVDDHIDTCFRKKS